MENQNTHKKFVFSEYYKNNAEFRKKHIAYMASNIVCDCGKTIIRSYKPRHLKTPMHTRTLNKLLNSNETIVNRLKNEIDELKKLIPEIIQ